MSMSSSLRPLATMPSMIDLGHARHRVLEDLLARPSSGSACAAAMSASVMRGWLRERRAPRSTGSRRRCRRRAGASTGSTCCVVGGAARSPPRRRRRRTAPSRRGRGSRRRARSSAPRVPITRMFLYWPVRMNASAIDEPVDEAGALLADVEHGISRSPSRRCTNTPVPGKHSRATASRRSMQVDVLGLEPGLGQRLACTPWPPSRRRPRRGRPSAAPRCRCARRSTRGWCPSPWPDRGW